ncbi:hypothetical protein LguiA_030735 [Lonicera macranthoides]
MSSSVSHLIYTNPLLLILFVALLLNVTLATTNYQGNETDSLALFAFKSNLHDPRGVLNSWNSSVHICQWQGITCGLRHRRATVLNLSQIPPEIGRLFRLQNLILHNNSLEGEIPANLSHCTNLMVITVANNKLVGEIPIELTTLSNLIFLSLSQNYLWGEIWTSFGNLTSLGTLSLAYNALEGSIPDTFEQLMKLSFLGIAANEISGMVPSSIYNLSSLTILSLGLNQLRGSIAHNVGVSLPYLETFDLECNQFTGAIPTSLTNHSDLAALQLSENNFMGKILTNFGSLQNLQLEELEASNNQLGGVFPNSLGNHSTRMRHFGVGMNQISRVIPSRVGSLFNLEILHMAQNQFKGEIPDVMGEMKKLQELAPSKNRFSGTIRTSLGNISSLSRVYLQDNKLEGTIPSSLGNCKNLISLDLSQNNLSGRIPKELFSASAMFELNLSRNHLVGPIPSQVGNIKNLVELDASKNKLSSKIPIELGKCCGLVNIYLGGNFFEGSIHPSFEYLRGVQNLDISNNNLLGTVPIFLASFSVESLNLSFNNFEGELPTNGVFENLSAIFVVGNNDLYGGIPAVQQPRCKTRTLKEQGISHFHIILISGGSLLLVASIALIYVFMPNGSLERWLNSSRDTDNGQDEHRILNLHQRINIAMDVACALKYLHFHCEKPIVHCHLKPSNILLDRDMVAHVGDFGLAKFLLPVLSNANQSSSNGIRGIVGCIAPEYGLGGKVSMNGDVYNYGILLLEMMIGRSPIDPMFNEGLNLHNFAKMALPNHVKEIVESKLLSNIEEEIVTTTSNNN